MSGQPENNAAARRPPEGPRWAGIARGVLALMVVLVGALFHFRGNTYAGLDAQQATRSIFVWLTQRWNDSALSFGGNYSHGWLVPLVSAWLVWHRRRELLAAPRAPQRAGLAVVAAALALHWVGARGELPQVSVAAFIGLSWGIPLYLFGRPTARILFFPCAYLFFAVPVGFLDSLTFPLRMLATVISGGLLNGIGVPVVRVGTALHSTLGHGFSLDVADPCSGIRSLAAMMAVTAAYAYVTQPTTGRKWALFLSAIPLAVIGNIGRILAIGVVAALFGMQAAMGVYHDYSGYVLYAFAIGSMLLVDRQLNRRAPARPAPAAAGPGPERRPAPAEGASRALARAGIVVCGLTALMLGLLSLTAQPAGPGPLALKADLPSAVADWRGEELRFCQNPACLREFALGELADPVKCPVCGGALDTLAYAERQLLPADTLLVRKRYERPGWPPIFVAIVFSGGSRSSIHRPEICTIGQGFTTTRSMRFPVPLAGRAPLEVTGIDLKKDPGRGRPADSVFLAYWFGGGRGRETASHTRRILWMAADRLLHGQPTRWAYVLIQMPGSVPASITHRRVAEFIRHLHPLLQVAPVVPGSPTGAP